MPNIWEQVLERLRAHVPEEDFRRWFGSTTYASDSGDQLTVWVPTESIRRHIVAHYERTIERELAALGRPHPLIRLVVTGEDDEGDED